MPNRNNVLGPLRPDYRSIVLPSFTAVLVSTLAHLRRQCIMLDIGSEIWHMRFSAQQGLSAGLRVCVHGEWLGHQIVFWFPQVLLERTLRTCLPDLQTMNIPSGLLAAIASNAIGMWLKTLPYCNTLRIDAVEDSLPPADNPMITAGNTRLHLIAHCHSPAMIAIEYSIAIDLDPALIAALPKLCATLPPYFLETSSVLQSVPLKLQCEIGRVVVTYATLDLLRQGDILFFDPHAEPDAGPLTALTVQLSYRQQALMRAQIQQSNLMVITHTDMNNNKSFLYDDLVNESDLDPFDARDSSALPHTGEEFFNESSSFPASKPPGHDNLNQLPMQVVFDVGDCEMSFAELQQLQPGSVIPLASRLPEVVRVTVNGRIIASGELVEIDGKIGVLLARLADAR